MLLPSSRGGTREAPTALQDPQLRATGAVVATLIAHRRSWVRRHTESVALDENGELRREVTVEFELPAIAWAMAPAGAPVIVPLGLVPKAPSGEVTVHDESGDSVAIVPDPERVRLAAAGLTAVAISAGAAGDAITRLAWRIAAGTPDDAAEAIAELARGRSKEARVAWGHEPFRALARPLADRLPLLVALPEADRPRTLSYRYREELTPQAEPVAPGLYGRLARQLSWDGIRIPLRLHPLDEAGDQRLQVDAGDAAGASVEVDEQHRTAEIRATASPSRATRLAPLIALVAAVLLTAESIAAPPLARSSSLLSLVLVVPAVVAAYVARRPEHPVSVVLLRGWRGLLFAIVVLCLTGQLLLAFGASKSLIRPGAALLATVALLVGALLLETHRRFSGGAPLRFTPRVARAPAAADRRRPDAVRLAALAVVMAGGLMIVALADATAREGLGGARPLFWLGLLAIYVPALAHAWRGSPRSEALAGVVILGLALYLVKVLHSPLHFTLHDEFSTLRTTLDIHRFGHLFEENPLIGVHPSYPALELVTSGVSSITGLSTFASATVVLGVLRVALMAALFLVFESAVSTRVAALATALYACNPNFVFFDSQWAYESFALPLALVVVAMAARGRRMAWFSVPIVAAVCVSHPLTSIALVVFLVVWAAIDLWLARRAGRPQRRELWGLAGVGALCTLVWAVFVARDLGGYLGPVLGKAGNSLADLLLAHAGPKRIFGGAGVEGTPLLEQLLGFAAVGLALAAIVFGVRPLWKRFSALGGALALGALAYPVSLPLRLTDAGTEISNRASEFVFVGVALLGALALTDRLPARRPAASARRLRATAPAVAALGAIALVGGVVIGTAPWSRIPVHYRVEADEASIEPEGLSAAAWARTELGARNRIFTDRVNGLLMGSIGLQDPQTGSINGVPVPLLFTATAVDPLVRGVLVGDRVEYLVVDGRTATALPAVGFYFDRDEPGAYRHRHPLSLGALLKWDTYCPVGRAYDSGNIVIYDTGRVSARNPCSARPAGRAP